jgi:hypothetical protein
VAAHKWGMAEWPAVRPILFEEWEMPERYSQPASLRCENDGNERIGLACVFARKPSTGKETACTHFASRRASGS